MSGATLVTGLSTVSNLVLQNIVNFSMAEFCTNLAIGATTTATGIIFSEMGMGYIGSLLNMAVTFGASGIAYGINYGIQGVTEKIIDGVLLTQMAEAGLKTGLEQGFKSGGAAFALSGLTNAMNAAQLALKSDDPVELETYSKDESADLHNAAHEPRNRCVGHNQAGAARGAG